MAQSNVYYSRSSHLVKASYVATNYPPKTMILILQSVHLCSDTQIFFLEKSVIITQRTMTLIGVFMYVNPITMVNAIKRC